MDILGAGSDTHNKFVLARRKGGKQQNPFTCNRYRHRLLAGNIIETELKVCALSTNRPMMICSYIFLIWEIGFRKQITVRVSLET